MRPPLYSTREEVKHWERGVKDALNSLVDDRLNRAKGKRADAYRAGLASGRHKLIEDSPLLTRLSYVDTAGKPMPLTGQDVCDLTDLLCALKDLLRLTNDFRDTVTGEGNLLRYQEATAMIVECTRDLTEKRDTP